MENNSFSLEFQLPDGKDILQTAQNVINKKFNDFANVICSIHVVSAHHYIMSEISFALITLIWVYLTLPSFFLKVLCKEN